MKTTNSVEKSLYLAFCLISIITTLLSLTITFAYDFSRQHFESDKIISNTADYIATMPSVINMIENGYPDIGVAKILDPLCDIVPDISVAVVCDNQGARFYHTDRQKTGESYLNEDQEKILSGAAPYIAKGYNSNGTQRRAFHSIKNVNGEIIGFVMVSVFYENITTRTMSILMVHIIILTVMLIVSTLLSSGLMSILKRSLMGFNPEELLGHYLRQDQVLVALEEGILASDFNGEIIFCNATAIKLLGDNENIVGKNIKNLLPQTKADEVLKTSNSVHNQNWVIGKNTVVANEIPIKLEEQQNSKGVLTVLFDKTEMLNMSDELFGAKSMLETLRAFNHEFLNKLHVILGYLENGSVTQAKKIILNSELISSQQICQAADLIRAPELSALLLGKMLRAAELGIALSIMPDSHCVEQQLLLPIEECTSLVGNLLQNSIDELSKEENVIKEIKMGIYCREDCNIFTCEDTGGGIAAELVDKMFENGVSTKGKNRGTGLWLVQRIVNKYDGKIDLDTEHMEGTCFTVTFIKGEG